MLRSASMHCGYYPLSAAEGTRIRIAVLSRGALGTWNVCRDADTETTQQHTDHREIPLLCPQFRATHTFDSDIVKLLLDRRLEYGVHFL